jgi:hypothetical protein
MTPDAEDLLEHVVDYLCGEQAEALEGLSDGEIRRRAAAGIARAQSHGLTQPEPITAYVSLMFLVAPDFDRQSAIARALAAKAPEAERIGLLFQKTKEADWEEAAAESEGWDAAE